VLWALLQHTACAQHMLTRSPQLAEALCKPQSFPYIRKPDQRVCGTGHCPKYDPNPADAPCISGRTSHHTQTRCLGSTAGCTSQNTASCDSCSPALHPAVAGQVDGMQEAWTPAQVQQTLQCCLLQLWAGSILACRTQSAQGHSQHSHQRPGRFNPIALGWQHPCLQGHDTESTGTP
jgi:hypothetical protein